MSLAVTYYDLLTTSVVWMSALCTDYSNDLSLSLCILKYIYSKY